MIFINTYESTAYHLGALRSAIKKLGYNGTAPIITEILYDDGKTRNQKELYAFTSPPPGKDDRCLFLNMDEPQLYRLSAESNSYSKIYTFVDGYFADAALQSVEDVQQYINQQVETQIASDLGGQIPQSVVDQVAQQVTQQITQNSGIGVIPIQNLVDLSLQDTSTLSDKALAFIEDKNALFHYDQQSTDTPDGINVVLAKNNVGRWVKVVTGATSSGSEALAVQNIAGLVALNNTGLSDKTVVFVEDENTFFNLDIQSNQTIDNTNIVRTFNNIGRWLRTNQFIDGGSF